MFYYPLVIDPTGLYSQYLKTKHEKTIRVEYATLGPKSYRQIEEAVREGGVLLLEDFDQSLLEAIAPIIEWKEKKMKNLLAHYATDPLDAELTSFKVARSNENDYVELFYYHESEQQQQGVTIAFRYFF